ncbi:hypothetical protein DFP87_103864 [Achromobacter marplatensis]|uniref:Uncharacterized protein n=2 Tax=Achromobacter marplatensis TaxID=470868 RepID=A0ABX9GH13_9BURK|nr:hypothetical protein DFP87_103864 [Achromobacter marplatensis]CAB3679883.1 hypothetical protein LMG26219_04264 [Achromobacter marplatensis]
MEYSLHPLPPPSVPQSLCDMLEDYPDCVERLQDCLNRYVGNPSYRDLFRGAILALQGTLQTLSAEAGNELAAAKVTDDARMIASASKKQQQLFTAGWFVFEMVDMEDLWAYFRANKDAFK